MFLVVAAQLQHHQLPDRVHQIHRVERSPLGLAPRRGFLEKRLVAEEAHALLHRQVFAVQADGDDGARQADERFGELAKLDGVVAAAETASVIICSQ